VELGRVYPGGQSCWRVSVLAHPHRNAFSANLTRNQRLHPAHPCSPRTRLSARPEHVCGVFLTSFFCHFLAFGMLFQPRMQKWNSANTQVREAASVRGVTFLVIVVLCCIFVGASKVQTALRNRTPTVMSYDAFIQTRPNAEWLMLTNCQLNLFEAAYFHNIGDKDPHPNQYYIPVHGVGSPAGRICILLKTSEPDLMATMEQMRGLKNETTLMSWTGKNAARVFPKRTVQGVILSGLEDLKSTDRSKLRQLHANIADDFIVLDSNAEPSLTAGISYSAAGLVALFGMVVYARRKSAD